MDAQDRLTNALGKKYDVIVHFTGDSYLFFLRELGLRHADASLERGFSEILDMKDRFIRDVAAEGLWDWIVEPGARGATTAEPTPGPLRKLLPFFIKLGCVSFLVLVLVAYISNGLREVGYGLEKKLDKIVSMTPETAEQHRTKARAIADKLRPIVLEVLSMFQPAQREAALPAGEEGARPSATQTGAASPDKP